MLIRNITMRKDVMLTKYHFFAEISSCLLDNFKTSYTLLKDSA